MLKIGFPSLSYLITSLACVILTNPLESSEIRILDTEYGKRDNRLMNEQNGAGDDKIDETLDQLIRVDRRYNKPEHVFGRIARNEAFQKSPLIRFGKRFAMEDGLSETLARLQQQQHLLDQEQYLKGKNRFRR